MQAANFLFLLEKYGFNFFTGVPCSYLAPLCRLLEDKEAGMHVPAVREDLALGLAAGAYLAGKKPVVYMQNSGLGYSLEVLASLHYIYHIPTLVLVSYRGPADQGWEEHAIMGEHTEGLLKLFQVRYAIIRETILESELSDISNFLQSQKLPYFLLITLGALQ